MRLGVMLPTFDHRRLVDAASERMPALLAGTPIGAPRVPAPQSVGAGRP